MPPPSSKPVKGRIDNRQHGVVAIEFALIFLLGVLPLLFVTFTGVMVFAAKQALTLAATDGARAALRYGDTQQRRHVACQSAQASMQWLLNFSGQHPDCANPDGSAGISVSAPQPCFGGAQCITVMTSYDYDRHPFLPGTDWLMQRSIQSSATIQLDANL
jgi:hypothetical protein